MPIIKRRLRKFDIPTNQFDLEGDLCGADFSVSRGQEFKLYKERNGAEFILIDGFSMIVKVDGALLVGEVVRFPPEQFQSFMKAVAKLAKRAFTHKVIFSFSSNHWLLQLFVENRYTPQSSLPIGFLPLEGFVAAWPECTFARLDYDTF